MIIECKTCHARFRLDESKIQGRGARVKCRKCGEPIVVLKDQTTGILSQEPGRDGSLDLGSAIRESFGSAPRAGEKSPPDNLIPFPGPARTTEPPAPAAKDEVDLAFEQLLVGEGKAAEEEPPIPEPPPFFPEGETGEEREEAAPEKPPDLPDEPSFEPPVFEPPSEHAAEPPAFEPPVFEPPSEHAFEPPAFEPPVFEPSPEPTAEPPAFEPPPEPTAESSAFDLPLEPTAVPSAFDLPLEPTAVPSASEPEGELSAPEADLPLLQSRFPETEEAVPEPPEEARPLVGETETHRFPQDRGADISLSIAEKPAETEPSPLRDSSAYDIPGEPVRGVPEPEEISLEGNVTPPADVPEASVPPDRPDTETEEESAEDSLPFREPIARMEPTPSRPSYGLVGGIVFLIALLSAVGFFGFTEPGKKLAGGFSARLSALLGGGSVGNSNSRFELKNVIGNVLTDAAASPRMLVITGEVTNRSSIGKSGIRVSAALLDNTSQVLMEKTVYAGNVLRGAKLKTGDRATLEQALANPLGERLANMDVLPGKSVPFMVLFFDVPESMDSYRVEAIDTQ